MAKGRCVQPGDLRPGRPDPGLPDQLADRRHGRPHLLRRRHCDHPPRRDPPAAGTTRFGDRRERQTDHRPAVPLHRRKVRRPAARGPATSARRVGRATQRDSDRGGPGLRGTGGGATSRNRRRAGTRPVTGSPVLNPSTLLVRPFPAPGQLVALAYRELDRAAAGSPEQIRALGDARLLPRPWEPATCRTPRLREQLWLWLDAVVEWLVTEYVWEAADAIPACWPQHPHLVHEIAVLADHAAAPGHAFTSDAMEEWHRYSLPAFTERMKSRLRQPLRGRPPSLACERPPHPIQGRDQPTHPG